MFFDQVVPSDTAGHLCEVCLKTLVCIKSPNFLIGFSHCLIFVSVRKITDVMLCYEKAETVYSRTSLLRRL